MDTAHEFAVDVSRPTTSVGVDDGAAEIRITVGGNVLTRMYDAEVQEATDILRAPVVPLALFLADNWWRLHFEPFPIEGPPSVQWRIHHEMTAISASVAWPPAMIYGTGEKVVFSPRAGGIRVPGPSVFFDPPVMAIDVASFDAGLDLFFAATQQWREAPDGKALCRLLDSLNAERADADVAAWRRLEARLGYDPDAAPDALIESLGRYEARLGESAVGEAAVAAPGPRAAEILQQALDAAGMGLAINRDVAKFGSNWTLPMRSRPIWEDAEEAAAVVRRTINVEPGPIRGSALGDILHMSWEAARDAPVAPSSLPYGAVARLGNNQDRVALKTRYAASRRFELARALGDAVWDSESVFAPLSRAKTERQKFQRAFAQSFLCPFDDLREFIGTDKPNENHIQAASIHFHVSELVVRTLLVNKRVLPREGLSERLEAA